MILLRFQTLTQVLTIPVQIVHWQRLLCNNLFPQEQESTNYNAKLPGGMAFASVRRTSLVSLIWYEKAAHTVPGRETVERFNHGMISEAKLQESTGHAGGTVRMHS